MKIRFWDHEAKKMISWNEAKTKRLNLLLNDEEANYDYTPMLCSGLPDINSDEIYDRDIIKMEDRGRGVIDFENGHFIIRKFDRDYDLELYIWYHKCRIIGNTFENPTIDEVQKSKEVNNEKEDYTLYDLKSTSEIQDETGIQEWINNTDV